MPADDLPPCPVGDGGGGGVPPSPRRDADVIRRAIRERWPIPEDVRAALPAFLGAILAGSEDARARVAAAKALIEADKLNLEQERRDQAIPDRLDITSGGQPLADLKALSDDELARRIAEARSRAGAAGGGPPAGGPAGG